MVAKHGNCPGVVILVQLPFCRVFWHLAFTTSTVAPLRVARLGWLPSQANLPLRGGWHRNRKTATGHEMLNQQSEKLSFLYTTQNWIVFANLVATYNFAASLFCIAQKRLHAVAVLMGHVRYRHRTSPSSTSQRKQGRRHRGTTSRIVVQRIAGRDPTQDHLKLHSGPF